MAEPGGVADPNAADQAAAWNGAMGARWLAFHRGLDRMLTPFGSAVMEAAGDVAGSTVIDLGCGTGETSSELAARVGPDGRVIGLDISEPLIAHARTNHDRPGLDFVAADGGAYDAGRPVDLIASRFGTMFFPDPAAAFAHLASSLSSDGVLAMVVWQSPDRNEWVHRPLQAAGSMVELPPPPPPGSPGPFSLADPASLSGLLRGSGFTDVVIESCEREITIDADAETTARFLLSVLPTGPLVDALDEAESVQLVEVVAAALPEGSSVSLGGAAHLVTARC